MVGAKSMLQVMKERRLWWFGHVKRKPGDKLTQRIPKCQPERTRI